jgi:hypothetical protein
VINKSPLFLGLWQGNTHGGKLMVEQSCSPHGGEAKERKRGMDWGPKNPLLGHVPSDPEFPTRLCLLQFPTTSQKCQAKNKAFNAWAFGGQFRSKI